MIEFAKELMSPSLAEEAMPLARTHFAEADPFPEMEQANGPRMYLAQDFSRIFTARDDGRLVGYATFIVHKHPHYADSRQAQQDLVFMSPEVSARPFALVRFLKFCHQQLVDEGVDTILHHSTLRHDMAPILKRLGFEPIQTLHAARYR